MTTDSGMDVSPSWQELKEERDALREQLGKSERLAERESQSFRTLCFAIQRMEEIVGIDSGGYNGPGPALDAIDQVVRERDALAAKLEEIEMVAMAEGAGPMMREVIDASPAHTIATLKSEWQAEAFEAMAEEQEATNAAYPRHAEAYQLWRDIPMKLRGYAYRYRHQSREPS